MNSRIVGSLVVAVALAVIGGTAVAGMSMGSGGSRNADRGSGYYPNYGAGGRCRGGPCTRDDNRQNYGQGMGMGGGQGRPRQERHQYQQQYRYGQGGPGYGQRAPAAEQNSQEPYQEDPRSGPGYGRGAPGYAPRVPAAEEGGQNENQGYPRGGPGYGRGGPGAAPYYRQGGGF